MQAEQGSRGSRTRPALAEVELARAFKSFRQRHVAKANCGRKPPLALGQYLPGWRVPLRHATGALRRA